MSDYNLLVKITSFKFKFTVNYILEKINIVPVYRNKQMRGGRLNKISYFMYERTEQVKIFTLFLQSVYFSIPYYLQKFEFKSLISSGH